MERLTINDIDSSVLESIKKELRGKKDYMNMVNRKNELLRNHKFIEAMRVSKLIEHIEELAINDFLRKYNGELVKVHTLLVAMTPEEQERMSAYGNALVLLADAMETAVIECNTLIQKYHPKTRIEMFDKLVEIGKEAKRHVRMLDDYQADEFYMQAYGDAADNLCELAVNKAKGFIRKVKKHEETTNKKTSRNAEVA